MLDPVDVVILPGVTIGSGSVIAAGAVVASDSAPHHLHAGVPARPERALKNDVGAEAR